MQPIYANWSQAPFMYDFAQSVRLKKEELFCYSDPDVVFIL